MTHLPLRGLLAVLCALAAAGQPVCAAELYAADGVTIRWDNRLCYSAGLRMGALAGLIAAYPNADDGDRDFPSGLMSSRFDLLSVLDIAGDDMGAQLSVEGWWDSVYDGATGNTSPASYNALSAPASRFVAATRDFNGRHLDLADSFAYANLTIGGMPLSARVGRQTLLWGESLFFDGNGIAAAMAPVDYVKSVSTPDSYSKDAFLPVNQISISLQPADDLAIAAYYQFEWRAARLPGIGSYFSTSDVTGPGAERGFLAGGKYLLHTPDENPGAGRQFGVSLHKSFDDLEIGLYAISYVSGYPVLSARPAPAAGPPGYAGDFRSVYPGGIELYGASFSAYWGDSNIAGEISAHRHMPLVSQPPLSPYFLAPLRNASGSGYAEGDTLHGQVSLSTTFARDTLWDSADLKLEIAANDVLAVTENPAALSTSRSRQAASGRILFQPHYFQILPNLDAAPLISLGYNFSGHSSLDYTQNLGTGDAELGLSATYRAVWKADLTYTVFLGSSFRQPLNDRNFLLLSLERSF